jgi:hypothetical protein
MRTRVREFLKEPLPNPSVSEEPIVRNLANSIAEAKKDIEQLERNRDQRAARKQEMARSANSPLPGLESKCRQVERTVTDCAPSSLPHHSGGLSRNLSSHTISNSQEMLWWSTLQPYST